ncbi:MAG TPA: hypothetical protein VFA17_10225 [Thermoplasmata archaeon]|jgi:hypothetical protein|nr:hypothetical protein [Thermoplasmata archaeon]
MELWTYYKVKIEGSRVLLLRLTGESGGRIFALEVDEHGKSIRRSDGTLRFHVLDRKSLVDIVPLTLLAGRLVLATKQRPEGGSRNPGAQTKEPVQPPA